MKFIYLAAGKNSFHLDGREDKPKCLSLFSEGMTIIDKILTKRKYYRRNTQLIILH